MRARPLRIALVCGLALTAGVVAVSTLAAPDNNASASTRPGRPAPVRAGHAATGVHHPSGGIPWIAQAGAANPFSRPLALADAYAFTRTGMLSPTVAKDPELVYVPNSGETGMGGTNISSSRDRDTVTVIDPKSFRIVGHFPVGRLPQHVTPSWDLRTLWVDASGSNQLVPLDPRTAKPGKPVPVDAPYNLYFTPDGGSALVMAERRNHLDVRDPHTMALRRTVTAPCSGINHADFSPDGSYFIASCEFSGQLLKFDTATLRILGELDLGPNAMPQDVRLGPDGRTFYVAGFHDGDLIAVDGATMRQEGTIPTGAGAHGIYPSRDGTLLYVSNRQDGSVSVVDPGRRTTTATWRIPGGGSPDMGGVSADGTQLWLSGRDHDEVYVFGTADGRLLARIRVGANPHGLAFFPQPGRYSLGHTGNYR
ncbi:YncE family protein [Streptantibioticus ferralitis]|uniref:YncE family protein n=1 Tax=Streptantibioticus ferralitis TaxID=236510 RepID=A0ABT5YX77_9ACTN|nr:YncE family protein [Streptantibioticus ferralitis]MDF2256165.1 YncE family protein [Streptantibioticus ferralitis]